MVTGIFKVPVQAFREETGDLPQTFWLRRILMEMAKLMSLFSETVIGIGLTVQMISLTPYSSVKMGTFLFRQISTEMAKLTFLCFVRQTGGGIG